MLTIELEHNFLQFHRHICILFQEIQCNTQSREGVEGRGVEGGRGGKDFGGREGGRKVSKHTMSTASFSAQRSDRCAHCPRDSKACPNFYLRGKLTL